MERVAIRELQQHASAVLRRVRRGETIEVTDRGTLIAVISPPPPARGAAALIAAGRVRPATRRLSEIDAPLAIASAASTASTLSTVSTVSTQQVLDDLRSER